MNTLSDESVADANGCTCLDKTPRTSLEHGRQCPIRISFYGAPGEWGVGFYGELRITVDGRKFEYTGPTWVPIFTEDNE